MTRAQRMIQVQDFINLPVVFIGFLVCLITGRLCLCNGLIAAWHQNQMLATEWTHENWRQFPEYAIEYEVFIGERYEWHRKAVSGKTFCRNAPKGIRTMLVRGRLPP